MTAATATACGDSQEIPGIVYLRVGDTAVEIDLATAGTSVYRFSLVVLREPERLEGEVVFEWLPPGFGADEEPQVRTLRDDFVFEVSEAAEVFTLRLERLSAPFPAAWQVEFLSERVDDGRRVFPTVACVNRSDLVA
ncbi:MAG: hypothetical protein AAGF92_04305 [Myxococcota bacterium]